VLLDHVLIYRIVLIFIIGLISLSSNCIVMIGFLAKICLLTRNKQVKN